jgi:hypothetical protein
VQGKAWREEIPQASSASLSPAFPLPSPKLCTHEKVTFGLENGACANLRVSAVISWWCMSELRGEGYAGRRWRWL